MENSIVHMQGNNKFLFSLLIIFIGAIFVIEAPSVYDKSYCIFMFVTTITLFLYFTKMTAGSEGYFNFHTIFILFYILINYEHACFIFPNDDLFPSLSRFPYDTKVIPYALSVAQIGLFSYMSGVLSVNRNNDDKFIENYLPQCYSLLKILSLSLSVVLLLYVITLFDGTNGHLYPRLMILSLSLIFVCLFINCQNSRYDNIKDFVFDNKISIFSIILFCTSQIVIGSRAEVLFLILPILSYINRNIHKIRIKYILIPSLFSLIFFAIISYTRITSDSLTNTNLLDVIKNGWDIISDKGDVFFVAQIDLIVNSRNLYDGISYVNTHGLLMGGSYLPYLFVFIPFGANILIPILTGRTVDDLNTAHILSNDIGAYFGIGTNIIGDIYMNYSMVGVIVIMFLFGRLIQICRQSSGIYCQLLYYSCFGNAIYLPRACWLCWMDMFAMCSIIYYIFINVINKNGKS